MSYSIFPLGDSALTVDFGNVISPEINAKVLQLAAAIERSDTTAIKDIVPAYSSVTIHYNVVKLLHKHPNTSAFKTISQQVEALLSQPAGAAPLVCRQVQIPVCYSAKYGLDLAAISAQTRLSIAEIVTLHTARTYKVFMIGFLPGFAYMGTVDDRIAIARKPEPRQKTPAGSVGIAGVQTGIYPFDSPGGWQIIGKTPLQLFNKNKAEPALLQAGDEVQFYSITADEFDNC